MSGVHADVMRGEKGCGKQAVDENKLLMKAAIEESRFW